jgi:hypothetical protein
MVPVKVLVHSRLVSFLGGGLFILEYFPKLGQRKGG